MEFAVIKKKANIGAVDLEELGRDMAVTYEMDLPDSAHVIGREGDLFTVLIPVEELDENNVRFS